MSEPCRASRHIAFEGARNVRDLGGLPAAEGITRFGVVYRADGLSRLTDADLARLSELGVRSIVDLRYDEERQRAPDRVPAGRPYVFFHRGFVPQGSLELFEQVNRHGADAARASALMCANYARIPFEHANEFRDLMRYLVQPGGAPHLVHCTSGKDRTGILVAFVLRALGVAVDEVVADYELSNVEHQPVDVFGPRARPDAIEIVMSARGEFLRASLDAIDRQCGSFDAYLGDVLDFGQPERDALRAMLLE